MLKNKGFIILLGVLLLLNVSFVLGATSAISSAFEILKNDFNIPQLYDKYPEVIESLIYMTLFIALGMKAAETTGKGTTASPGTAWSTTRAGKTVFVVLGIMLGIATMLGFRKWGITLLTFGTYGGLILMLGLIWGVWKLFDKMTPVGENGKRTTSAKAFFTSFGILLGYSIANTITGGELASFLGNPNNPFIASIFNLALAALFITMFISLIMMLFSAVGKGADSTTSTGEKKGFLNSLADGIRNVTNGSKNVYDAVRNIGIKDNISVDVQEAYNSVISNIDGFVALVNHSVANRQISEGEFNQLRNQANNVNTSLATLYKVYTEDIALTGAKHPNINIGSVRSGKLIKYLKMLAQAHENMLNVKIQ